MAEVAVGAAGIAGFKLLWIEKCLLSFVSEVEGFEAELLVDFYFDSCLDGEEVYVAVVDGLLGFLFKEESVPGELKEVG